jgi:C-terminal processing protease CtpA/Prc
MKKITVFLFSLLMAAFALQGCENDMDDTAVPVNDFIWKGLNLYYLWKAEIPALDESRYPTQDVLNNYLEAYPKPENLFESLLYQRGTIDKWSVLVSDFNVLENALQGISKSTGVDFSLVYTDDSESSVVGYVRYILPNTDASGKNIKRGDIFYAVNGTPLTADNYQSLLGNDTYTLNLADYTDGEFVPNGQEVSLTKTEYAENPVYNVSVVNSGSHTIGYLMYNGFYSTYDGDLNAAFGQLSGQGVTDLVLDLRYNSGGSVRTATYLGSMITGQFTGQMFSKQQWNERLQKHYESEDPGSLVENFASQLSNSTAINHLNLNKVYILTSRSTASASELVINCLSPYIDVVVIGDTTTGKNVGSVTLYDSPTYTKKNLNGSHRYAMQPIVLKVLNKENFGEYSAGIKPTGGTILKEKLGNMGVIGNEDEPLFAAAIAKITGKGKAGRGFEDEPAYKPFRDSKNMRRFGTEMYIEELPKGSEGLFALPQ